jgi:hypothetical protein
LITTTFIVELIAADKVAACGSLDLKMVNTDASGEQRSNWIEYQIANIGADVNKLPINVKSVSSNMDMDECPLEMYAEYQIQSPVGYSPWEEVRENDMFETNFDDGYFILKITQEMFLEKKSDIFNAIGAADLTYSTDVQEVSASFRFVIANRANITNALYDEFTVHIKSSGEDESTLCADSYTMLAVDGQLTSPLHYKIGDN